VRALKAPHKLETLTRKTPPVLKALRSRGIPLWVMNRASQGRHKEPQSCRRAQMKSIPVYAGVSAFRRGEPDADGEFSHGHSAAGCAPTHNPQRHAGGEPPKEAPAVSLHLDFCSEQLANVLVELSDHIRISTEERKMTIDRLDWSELGFGK